MSSYMGAKGRGSLPLQDLVTNTAGSYSELVLDELLLLLCDTHYKTDGEGVVI